MAGVVVVKLRWLSSFVRRAERFAIPVGDNVDAVGIRRWNQKQYCVLQDLTRIGILCGRKLVSELHRHLRSYDFSRMDRARNRYDDLAVCEQPVALNVLS